MKLSNCLFQVVSVITCTNLRNESSVVKTENSDVLSSGEEHDDHKVDWLLRWSLALREAHPLRGSLRVEVLQWESFPGNDFFCFRINLTLNERVCCSLLFVLFGSTCVRGVNVFLLSHSFITRFLLPRFVIPVSPSFTVNRLSNESVYQNM